MGRSGLPTTLVICCPLPAAMPQATAEACLDFGRRSLVPVTWIAAIDRLPVVLGGGGTAAPLPNVAPNVALEIPAEPSRQELRQLLARAAAEAPGLDAVAIRGALPAEHRRVLVDSGIRVVCRDRFDDVARGSRRPAPHGWPCRSTLWGLWEVTQTTATPPGLVSRLLPWGSQPGPVPGALAVLDMGGQGPVADTATIRGRMEQWRSWAERRNAAGQVVFATLSDLPALIAGAGRIPVGGSVLKAA
jgi:hypothetical protein